MAPRQVELQLGHMCNNRCTFCVSGQETELGRAGPAPTAPAIEQLRAARASGAERITLLGGEPTLQPGFLAIVQEAARLGFSEIVVFTNGAKTARLDYIDEIIAAGQGKVTWRLSFQGATREAHEATTRKPGSFARLVSTLQNLHTRRQIITVNMCVVSSNYTSVTEFPRLLLPYGVRQLHLDMMRPLDAGQRTEEELAETLPRYSDLAVPLTLMIAGFPPGFDVNIGNLPYCVAPHLTPWIHHDGEPTDMVAVDGNQRFSRPLDKYLTKRRDKLHLPSCASCAFAPRCSGIFETYARLKGTDEFSPVDLTALQRADPEGRLRPLRLRLLVQGWSPPPPLKISEEHSDDHSYRLILEAPKSQITVELRAPGSGLASTREAALWVANSQGDKALVAEAIRSLWAWISREEDVLHPLGDDAFTSVAPTVAARLRRLRDCAPFGMLRWKELRVSAGGTRAEILWQGPSGEQALLWLAEQQGRATGGYRIVAGEATEALIFGLREIIKALRRPLASVQRSDIGT
ncbi:MAG: radical SAM protein [Myxococcales bacterium]|nr:radical SAM protein [Polyangiaceae bacterium]MDW8248430.1 radical SAM protein [Myxococcales bacterium]